MSTRIFVASDQFALMLHQWEPEARARGVIFIAHGLAEHGDRYARTAKSLNAQGFVVVVADLRGHGQSAKGQEDLGFFAEKNGWQRVVLDVEEILAALKTDFPQLPLILLGHSMGSYIAQQVIYERPTLLTAAIFSGPNGKPSLLAQAGRLVAREERMRLGKRGRSQFINSLTFGKFNEQFAPTETPFDWLTRDQTEVKLYFNDSRCGFLATTQLWVDFLDGIKELSVPARKTRIPKDFPIYIMAGDRDPVCENGKGAEALAQEYRAVGIKDVTLKIYPEARHELLNETNRFEVIEDLVQWIEPRLPIASA